MILRSGSVGVCPRRVTHTKPLSWPLHMGFAARITGAGMRALANLDALIERARSYGVASLRAFIRDLQTDWERKARAPARRPPWSRARSARLLLAARPHDMARSSSNRVGGYL